MTLAEPSRDAIRLTTLPNGLVVAVAEDRRTPIVASVLWLRTGASSDPEGAAGTAHFLEHMMFKGSANFGPGEVDRLTLALGGSNNAFTAYDSTAYHFCFAADRWLQALDIEADRMAGLRLDEAEVESERRVILEEIGMYEGEPWDALATAVQAALFAGHVYGRQILGSRAEVGRLSAEDLRAFHGHHHRPANGVLVVAGDVSDDVEEQVAARFGAFAGEAPAVAVEAPPAPSAERRVTVRRGEVPRMMMAFAAPSARDPRHAALRLLMQLLMEGRASRLHRRLVEEERVAAWVSGEVSESVEAGSVSIALELLPGVVPAAAEEALRRELAVLATERPSAAEIERAKRVWLADRIFGEERVENRAIRLAGALAHHGAGHLERYEAAIVATPPQALADVVDVLSPERAVVGWALPEAK